MATDLYLAMTASEFAAAAKLPPKAGWMACHFSPYGTGLSNLPASLPQGSLLILNDRIPILGHDPLRIEAQLAQAVDALSCAAVLLDFQTVNQPALRSLARHLVSSLPCPVSVCEEYAEDLACPVFLSPCPHHSRLTEHILPWSGRECWLDLAVDAETITLTEKGATILPLPLGEVPEAGRREEMLHCHYSIENTDESSRFTLWRTREDLNALKAAAEHLGIHTFIGLQSEWHEGK